MQLLSFLFNDTATTEIYTLSLHDALPISSPSVSTGTSVRARSRSAPRRVLDPLAAPRRTSRMVSRSEEHTSELQSRRDLVCRLLLEKKKPKKRHTATQYRHSATSILI